MQVEGIPSSRLAVRARGITKCFDDVVALEAVDLDAAAGQIHGLVGPNGAGKTTLLGLLLGLVVPARQVAAATPGIRVIDDAGTRPDGEAFAVRALLAALDELVPRLVQAGIAVRGLTPVVSPLESAFLALTEQPGSSR